MAPLAHTLALLAMAVASVAIEVVPLNMAWNSFDDQYLECNDKMFKKLRELQRSDFLENDEFARNWAKAKAQWQEHGPSAYPPLPQDEVIALVAYTMKDTNLYKQFNDAVHEGGSSSWKYRHQFHFKSLHFLLSSAIQKMKYTKNCRTVFRGVSGVQYKVEKDDEVRFGEFVSASLSEWEAQRFGKDTMFKVYTCTGVNIRLFYKPGEENDEVLIPSFEYFKVIGVSKEGNTMHIEVLSAGTFSNYDCEWLKGGSLPRNSPHLGGLLLATVTMAVVTGTL